nr:hypothetical protein [Taibaiella sp.]
MKYFNPLKIVLGLALSVFASPIFAQIDSCNAFLQGSFIEVGVNTNGAYGSSCSAPPGFHPKGGASINNTCYPGYCVVGGTNVGFVADPAKDGWTVGTPPYFGDYFLPGSPQEGWSLQADSFRIDAWNGGSYCGGNPFTYAGSKRIEPGYANVKYSVQGKYKTTIWTGIFDSLNIIQTTIMDTTSVYFTVYVEIHNISTVAKHNIFYLRTVDPDNDEPEPGGGFTTVNTVEYQLPNTKGATLVSGVGQSSALAYLGLGTLDCRARCFIIMNSGLDPLTGVTGANGLDAMYNNGTGFDGSTTTDYKYSGANTQDQGIGLVFKLGDLNPGECTSLPYAYILRKADLDAAFASTKAKWNSFGDT